VSVDEGTEAKAILPASQGRKEGGTWVSGENTVGRFHSVTCVLPGLTNTPEGPSPAWPLIKWESPAILYSSLSTLSIRPSLTGDPALSPVPIRSVLAQ
jgi:hypothetical protein